MSSPSWVTTLTKIPLKQKVERESLTQEVVRPALAASSARMADWLEDGLVKGKLKNCQQPSLVACYTYFATHEWYHIGEICMTLTQAGHKLPDEVLYGIWEWSKH